MFRGSILVRHTLNFERHLVAYVKENNMSLPNDMTQFCKWRQYYFKHRREKLPVIYSVINVVDLEDSSQLCNYKYITADISMFEVCAKDINRFIVERYYIDEQ